MACRFCARRRRASSDLQVIRQAETDPLVDGTGCEAVLPRESPKDVRSLGLRDLSEEVLSSVFLCLRATEVLKSLEPCSKFLQSILVFGEPNSLWTTFLQQEFPGEGGPAHAGKPPKWLYHQLVQRRFCNSIEWRQVPLTRSNLGAREGSPGVFYKNGYVFVYGGWGFGPMRDLHAAPVDAPLQFREVSIQGAAPHPTYEAKVTVLEDPDSHEQPEVFRAVVTGGWKHGGYYEESGTYAIMEIDCRDGVKARWLRTGSMMPRANHTATYVPPRIAGGLYPDGYLLLFGGCIGGQSCNEMTLLDLSNYHWSEVHIDGGGPDRQNSHSATLVPCIDFDNEYAILFLGGGGGDDMNGGPPRGGLDHTGWEFWLRGLEGAKLRWHAERSAVDHLGGRGHVAVRLSGTDTVVLLGGGKPPLQRACAVSSWAPNPGTLGRDRLLTTTAKGPTARAFGGGCALPDGLAMIYGGWHPCRGTFSDVWVACFDDIGRASPFFQQLPVPAAVPDEPEDPEDSADDMAFNLVIRRLFGQTEGQEMPTYHGQDDDSEDSEEEADENNESEDDTEEADCQDGQGTEDLQDLMDDSSAPLVESSDED